MRGAIGEADASLPVQVWSVQSLASRTGASLAGGKLRDALKGHGDWTIAIIKRSIGRKQSKAPAPGLSSPASGSSHAGSQDIAIQRRLLSRALIRSCFLRSE